MKNTQSTEPFKLTTVKPFSTFDVNGKPQAIPFIVDGLLPNGSLSLLAAKPKQGKSNLSRHLAVCVSKGEPFLGRKVSKGEVLVVSLEDPVNHVDNHLKVLGWTADSDSQIKIATALAPTMDESLQAIQEYITANPDLKLIIIDVLQKLAKVTDTSEMAEVSDKVDKIHQLAKNNPQLHVMGLIHCKKTVTDSPFDSMLGSTGYRAESATNIVLFEDDGRRFICAETRIGKQIEQTQLESSLVQLDLDIAADYVRDYHLGSTKDDLDSIKAAKTDKKAKTSIEDLMVATLETKGSATHAELMAVKGAAQRKVNTIKLLVDQGVLLTSGVKGSQENPLTYSLNEDAWGLYRIGRSAEQEAA